MTWFKVDDGFSDHPKVRSMPRSVRAAAVGLWTLAGAWSAKNLTDGHIPQYMLAELGCTRGQAAALVQAGLWRRAGDGYAFHEWDGHQPSRQQVEDRRAKTAERVARWRAGRAPESPRDGDVGNAVTDGVTNGVGNAAPDPTRPDPNKYVGTSPVVGGVGGTPSQAPPAPPPRSNGHRIPDDWVPAPELRDDLRSRYARPDDWWRLQHEKFVNHFRAKAGKDARRTDWDLTFANWVHESIEREGEKRVRKGEVSPIRRLSTADQRVADTQALKRTPEPTQQRLAITKEAS